MKLSDNLKDIRKKNDLSQEQLVEKLGVSRQAVSKWESGQSYPEMDKLLLICKLFNYNIDELVNENVKEVNETKQSKINFNKYIEDFFNFITKTVNMLSSMKFKQRIKCLFEQIFVAIILLIIFVIIGAIGLSIVNGIFDGFSYVMFSRITSILQSIYIILALIIGITILLHIFKIRYLDYYEIVENVDEDNSELNKDIKTQENIINTTNNKIFLENKKEKIVIRDPEHSSSKFLTGIAKIVLWCIKFIVAFYGIFFAFTFVGLVALLISSFIFAKTGLVFFGGLLCLISAITINYIILQIFYNFIISKKNKKSLLAILFISSLIIAGIGIGIISIGITQFNYIEDSTENTEIEDIYTTSMNEKLYIGDWNGDIEFIPNDSDEVKIVVKHSKYNKVYFTENGYNITIHYYEDDTKIMEHIRKVIEDINNKEIKNYYKPKVYVYTSQSNIENIVTNARYNVY